MKLGYFRANFSVKMHGEYVKQRRKKRVSPACYSSIEKTDAFYRRLLVPDQFEEIFDQVWV
jgi:hypothetical protein